MKDNTHGKLKMIGSKAGKEVVADVIRELERGIGNPEDVVDDIALARYTEGLCNRLAGVYRSELKRQKTVEKLIPAQRSLVDLIEKIKDGTEPEFINRSKSHNNGK